LLGHIGGGGPVSLAVEVVDKALLPQLANARSAMLRVRLISGVKGCWKRRE
jgi:hypothetical protein